MVDNGHYADNVFLDTTVITVDKRQTIADALAIADDKILAVGTTDSIERLVGPRTRVQRCRGKAVLPGFIDSHCHMFFGGFAETSMNLSSARSIRDILQRLEARAKETPEGNWVLGYGYALERISEHRHPTRWELDSVVPSNPVWILPDSFHASATNSLGCDLINGAEIAAKTGDRPSAQTFEGIFPTDETHITARRRVFNFLSDEDIAAKIRAIDHLAISRGVTTIHACEGGRIDSDRDMHVLLGIKDELKTRIVPYYETLDVEQVVDLGLHRIGGCGRLNLDGMPDTHTAALVEPYSDRPDSTGILNLPHDVVERFVSLAHAAGLQIAAHAMGDGAIEQLITAYEKAQSEHPRADARHRIEHFHLPSDNQIDRAKALDLVVAMQPVFSEIWGGRGGVFESRFGTDRYVRIDRYKHLLDKGLVVCTGADSPAASIDPMRDLALLVDNAVDPEQSLSFLEAVKTITINGAYAAREEETKGSLEPGKLADLVVLDRVPLDCSAEDIRDIDVDMTMIGGKVVFENAASPR